MKGLSLCVGPARLLSTLKTVSGGDGGRIGRIAQSAKAWGNRQGYVVQTSLEGPGTSVPGGGPAGRGGG